MTEQEELKQLADECYSEARKLLHACNQKDALKMALRAKEIYNEIKDKRGEASVTNVVSLIYEEMGNATLELQFQLDALDIAIEDKAYDLSAKLYNNLGSKFLFSRANERALFYFQKAIEMSKKAEAKNMFEGNSLNNFTLVINMNISTAYYRMQDMEKAKFHYDIAKGAFEYNASEELVLPYLVFEALFFIQMGELEKAKESVGPVMAIAERKPYTTDYLEVFLDVIEVLRETHSYEEWKKILRQMDEHKEENPSIYLRLEVLNQWLIFYKETNEEDRYKEACVKYYELSGEAAKQDAEKEANSYEINAEMRRAMRQKKKTDSIIYKDPLTGIGNRNKMLLDSKNMIEESYKNNRAIYIGLLDIDFFKESNDTYGHIEGDHCLKTVAKIISETIGKRGSVYRYGGDEFLILMFANGVEDIIQIGAAIKEKLEEAKLCNEKSPICPFVTVSQGYTSAKAEKDDTIETLVTLADRVLYMVKRQGRDGYKYMGLDEIRAGME